MRPCLRERSFAPKLALLLPALLAGIALSTACGPATKAPATPPPPSSSASTAVEGPPTEDALCTRVCASQVKCGMDPNACRARCLAAARVLTATVTEQMVSCVEKKYPSECEAGDAGYKHRRQIVADCTTAAISVHEDDAKADVALFAKTWCDGAASCGAPEAMSASQCLGAAQGAIMADNADWLLYGSMRPSKVDEVVACIKAAPCVERPSAADRVNTCVLETLSKASTP